MSNSISTGGQLSKDPADVRVWTFSWDAFLGAGVELQDEGTFTVTSVHPRESPITLTIDEESFVTGNRIVTFRVSGGRKGTLYNIAHAVITNETPEQELERSFDVMVEEL